jgi:hypothetical protein
MRIASFLFLASALVGAQAYNTAQNSNNNKVPEISRRNMLATAAVSAAILLGAEPRVALASDEDVLTPLYFGVGVR